MLNSEKTENKKFYQVYLDKYTAKTLYRDEMRIPSYDLAVAIAEEWASQPCKL